jgi:hypothetical protein
LVAVGLLFGATLAEVRGVGVGVAAAGHRHVQQRAGGILAELGVGGAGGEPFGGRAIRGSVDAGRPPAVAVAQRIRLGGNAGGGVQGNGSS